MSPFAATMATADAHENTPMLFGKGTVTLPPAAEFCDSRRPREHAHALRKRDSDTASSGRILRQQTPT